METALLKWFEIDITQNLKIPLNRNMLKEKAMTFTRLLNAEDFNASAGWLVWKNLKRA